MILTFASDPIDHPDRIYFYEIISYFRGKVLKCCGFADRNETDAIAYWVAEKNWIPVLGYYGDRIFATGEVYL